MNMCKSNKRKTVPELCLQGQVFFIWSTYQSLEIVKDRISLLGGKVDPFLSRDVTTVLVEDNHLLGSQASATHLQAKPSYVGSQASAPQQQVKPLYVVSQASAPHLQAKPSYAASGTVVTSFPYQSLPSTSRGVLACSSTSPYRVICYALQWGIRVLGIDQFLTWIEPQVKTAITLKKKPAPESVSRLSGCFIKFESSLKNYRPCYKMFGGDPDRLLPLKNASVLVKAENCSIVLDQPAVARQIHFKQVNVVVPAAKALALPVKANDRKAPNNKLKPKDENNYCECCRTHFADLKSHIKSVKHQNFVSNEKNYEIVQNIIRMLPTAQEFINKLQNSSPDPGQVNRNAEAPQSVAATSDNTGLNLPLIQENVAMPIDLHVEREKPGVVNDKNENSLPLDLVKRVSDVKNEIKPEESLLNHFEANNPSQKHTFGLSAFQGDTKASLVSIKVEEPDPNIPCDVVNGDPLATTAALAQLCLKNFDSYWLDTLPCEMDDMVFEDIFDLDDGKPKLENDIEPTEVQFLASDMVQTPGLVSGISTPSFKTPTNTNMSFCMNSSLDLKDTKSESTNVPSASCKLEKGLNDVSFQNVTESSNALSFSCKLEKGLNEISSQSVTDAAKVLATPCKPEKEPLQNGAAPSLEPKKKIFSIATYCANKVEACSSKVDPSCSNANTELLFSSDTSDSENEHALISNVLSFINNNSDSELSRKSTNQNASCSKDLSFLAKGGTSDCSMSIPDQSKAQIEVDNSCKRQSGANLDNSDLSQAVPAKKHCSSLDHLRTINFSAVDLASNNFKVASSAVDLASSKSQVASSAVDFSSRKSQLAPSAVDLASSKAPVAFSAVDLASSKIQVVSCKNVSHGKVQMPTEPSVSFAKMKMKISPKDVHEGQDPAQRNSTNHDCDSNQNSIHSKMTSSTLLNNYECLRNNHDRVPLPETAIQQNLPLNLKASEQRQDLCKSVKPKSDFSIAHLTNDLENRRDGSCNLSKPAELFGPQVSSWDFQKKSNIPSKDLKANSQSRHMEASFHQPFVDASPGCEALSVLPKKAFRRKYVLPSDDQKQLNNEKAVKESQGEGERSPRSVSTCELEGKSRVSAANESDVCLQNGKSGACKDKTLPSPTSVRSDLSREVSPKAAASREESKKRSEVKVLEKPKLSVVSVGDQDSFKAFTTPKVVSSEACRTSHPAAEPSPSSSTRSLRPSAKSPRLPSHWTVSIAPGSAVKLKFTRVQQPKLGKKLKVTRR